MSTLNLGNVPLSLVVNLNRGADFTDTIRTSTGAPWPDGIVVRLVFNDTAATMWTATVVDDVISFNIDKAVVDATAAGGVQLRCTSAAGDEMLWASGTVVRNG